MTVDIWTWPQQHRATTQSVFTLEARSLQSPAPWVGQTAYGGPLYQRFVAKLTFPRKPHPEWRELSGFITRQRGALGLLRLVDYHRMFTAWDTAVRRETPVTRDWTDGRTWTDNRGWAAGFLPPTITVAEAAARGARSLVVGGLPASQTAVLTLGDLFEHRPNAIPLPHGSLYEEMTIVNTDSQGRTRVEFEPGLRVPANAGDQIVLRYPSSVFRLASDTEGQLQRSIGNSATLGLSAIEILPGEMVD